MLVVALADTGRNAEVLAIFDFADGHIRLKSAVGVQQGRQCDASRLGGHLLAGHFIEPGFGAGPADSGFGKAREVQQTHMVHDVLALLGHILEGIGSTPTRRFVAVGFIDGKIIGALPAVVFTKSRPGLFLIFINGAGTVGSGGIPPFIREENAVQARIDIVDFFVVVGPVGVRTVAAAVDVPHVDLRLTFHQPAGQVVTDTAGLGDAEAVAAGQEKVFQGIGGPDQRVAVGRVSDGTDGNVFKTGFPQNREAKNAVRDVLGDIVDILGQLVWA